MNKFLSVFLVVVVVILIAIIIFRDGGQPWSNSSNSVEITATPGTKIFAKLPEGIEQFLNSVPKFDNGKLSQIEVDVPINADVILRYNNEEEIITYAEWQVEKAISVDFNALISIQINANPWAYVFIKLPDDDNFIKPRRQDFKITPATNETNTNVTPIRGGLQVPIGTTIKLVYEGREKVFSYETWKENSRISHNFSNP